METKYYTLIKIEGEYAYLREDGRGEDSDMFIALFLLPLGADVGTRIMCEGFEYSIVD